MLTTIGSAHAGALEPLQAQKIELGAASGVGYYTIEPEGFLVVATLADSAGTPIRVQALLASGQSSFFPFPSLLASLPKPSSSLAKVIEFW
jgi:hypothetical protein